MAGGGHGLPKVSLGPAMPDPFNPCGRAPYAYEKSKKMRNKVKNKNQTK
jgi:hypothetical protein